jgi:hypothetical protein
MIIFILQKYRHLKINDYNNRCKRFNHKGGIAVEKNITRVQFRNVYQFIGDKNEGIRTVYR